MKRSKVLILFMTILSSACSGHDAKTTILTEAQIAQMEVPAHDFGDIDQYNSCSAKPRRELSVSESCWIKELSKTCGKYEDCMVTCLASPNGMSVGGGCWHICGLGPNSEEWWETCEKDSQK